MQPFSSQPKLQEPNHVEQYPVLSSSRPQRHLCSPSLGELGVVLTNLLLFVTCLGASVFTVTLAASLGLKVTGILP